MIDLIKEIIEPLLNPEEKQPFFKRLKNKETRRQELRKSADISLAIKDLTKTYVWQNILRPKIIKSLKHGFATLLRDGLTMSEVETKNLISNMRANLDLVSELRYLVIKGDDDAKKLSIMESKK